MAWSFVDYTQKRLGRVMRNDPPAGDDDGGQLPFLEKFVDAASADTE